MNVLFKMMNSSRSYYATEGMIEYYVHYYQPSILSLLMGLVIQ